MHSLLNNRHNSHSMSHIQNLRHPSKCLPAFQSFLYYQRAAIHPPVIQPTSVVIEAITYWHAEETVWVLLQICCPDGNSLLLNKVEVFVEGHVHFYGDDAVPLHVPFIAGFPSIMVNGLHVRMSLFLLIFLFPHCFLFILLFLRDLKSFSILHWC